MRFDGFDSRFYGFIFSGCPTLPGFREGWASRPRRIQARAARVGSKNDQSSKKKSESRLHDFRSSRAIQNPPADPAPLRARRLAEALALPGQHAPLHRWRSRAPESDPEPDPRAERDPGRNRNHSEHARQN